MTIDTSTMVEAVKSGDVKRVSELLTSQPELLTTVSPMKVSFLMMALYYDRQDVGNAFLAQGYRPDLFEAAALGKVEIVKQYLKEDPDLANAISPDGFPVLGLACFFDHCETAKLLLLNGADVNTPSTNTQRVMPLHSAAAAKSLELCRILIEYGADVNSTQQDDFTPLHAAAQNGDAAMIRVFLDHGAAVNPRTREGLTPLSLAIQAKKKKAADLLRKSGGVE
jgi:ankyrin repeat protein